MSPLLQGILAVAGRVMLCAIFVLSAAGNKIPQFNNVVVTMEKAGVPLPQLALVGAIVFLLVGSALVVPGWHTRVGATLLLVFLALATFYFHGFWRYEGQEAQQQMIQAMKNLSLMGAMVLLIANGPGPASLDNRRAG